MYKYVPYLIAVVCALLGAVSQVLFKKAMPLKLNIGGLITNYWLILGFFLYGLAFIGYLLVLKYAPVSRIYMVISLSYVFLVIFASMFLSEPITNFKIIGSVLIISGVALIVV